MMRRQDRNMNHSPWQSWSPAKPSLLKLPTWDYCPLPHSPSKKNKESKLQKAKAKSISYWCSWYAFGRKISEKLIIEQASHIKKKGLKIDHIIIDDGWTKWGDWNQVDLSKFPDGIVSLSKKLAKKKLKTGIWLAPFLADKKSILFKEHPEYFLRSKSGKLINGFKSVPPFDILFHPQFLLDFSKKEVREYIFKSIDQIIEKWNVSLLKLDFLYAPYFNPHLKNTKAASKQVRELFIYLKNKHPQVFTIACGCSFADAVNLADAIRISKDISSIPPIPSFIRKMIYQYRAKVLEEKLKFKHLWQNCLADPDVRMFVFDNEKTRNVFSQFENEDSILGFGDDMTKNF